MDLFDNKNIKPMLLSENDEPFNNNDYIYEIKFDGIRALIYVDSKEILIKSRNGKILNDKFPELLEINKNIKDKCIFDGEIISLEKDKPSFQKLQERMLLKDKSKINKLRDDNPVTFICFDILYKNKNLTNLTLIKRKEILSKYQDTEFFIKSRVVEDGEKLFKFIKKEDLEGIVAKEKNSKYLIGERTKEWIKIKNIKEDDFIIGAFLEKENVASLILGRKERNKLIYVSKVTIGKKKRDYKLIKSSKKTKNYFIDFNEQNYTYIEPKLICTISYLEKTKDGHLRHPVFKNIRVE